MEIHNEEPYILAWVMATMTVVTLLMEDVALLLLKKIKGDNK